MSRRSSPSNRVWAWAGIYAAREHLSPAQIADRLGEGVTAAEIEAMFEAAGIDPFRPLQPGNELVTVHLSAKHRTKLAAEARSRALLMPDFAGILLAKVAADGLFAAILE